MKKIALITLLFLHITIAVNGQYTVKGIVMDDDFEKPIQDVSVTIATNAVKTNNKGEFKIESVIGKNILKLQKEGYETQNLPINAKNTVIDVGVIYMQVVNDVIDDLSVITITDDELNNDTAIADNISGLLQSSKDVYLRTAAFDWSASFFKIRGLNSENAKVLINGIEMNKIYNGRPQWANWGGLNDVLRNQEFNQGLSAANTTFGGILGATNMIIKPSEERKGGKVSYASSDRSYQHRIMGSYTTGLLKNNWAFTFAGSFRYGKEGFNDGTSYNSFAAFTSIEKKINKKHNIGFTGIFTPNKRGKSSPNTQEVYDLKGIKYNEYWGWLNGKKINSRIKEVAEPIFMLHHNWQVNEQFHLNTNMSYQFGKVTNSRLDYTFATNPSAAYYQNLPSAFLEDEDIVGAYEAQQNFIKKGQLNWQRIYDANITNNANDLTAAYILYDDRNDDTSYKLNSIFNYEINQHHRLNGKFSYKNLTSENYAQVKDLLGSSIGYLDFDRFGNTLTEQQNNLQNPNRIVQTGERFKYNYILKAEQLALFLQEEFNYKKVDFFIAAKTSNTSYQREGLYENGSFLGNLSFGASEKISFFDFGFKGGVTYKHTGRHLINVNAAYITNAPLLKNTFFNARESNAIVPEIKNEKIMSADISYALRSPIFTGKVTGYYTSVKDASDISFFFADGLGGIGADDNAFVQEILTAVDKNHIGIEFGLEAQITSEIKLKTALNFGQYTYGNNPNLKLTSDAFNTIDLGKAYLKNYKLATGPQKTYAFGFEYRDPDYWWLSITSNYLTDTYIDIAPLTRTRNFYTDTDGLPFNDYDETIAKELLLQERFKNYTTVNVVGGKSWKIGDYYTGLFFGINNLFDSEYKTGGFEQARNANYRTLKEDSENPTKVFGAKYWYGRGTTYFVNLNFRF